MSGQVQSMNDINFEPTSISKILRAKIKDLMCEHYMEFKNTKMHLAVEAVKEYLSDKAVDIHGVCIPSEEELKTYYHPNTIIGLKIHTDGTCIYAKVTQKQFDEFLVIQNKVTS